MMQTSYESFIESKTQRCASHGFDPGHLPDFLFDFQQYITGWAIQKGRGGIFADCGLGKTPMELVWAQAIARRKNKPVLILTPLAVGKQMIEEGEKFGIECHRSQDGKAAGQITITNYERLERFHSADFSGVVCDESSILKSFDGQRRNEITAFLRKMEYRLLATATAAPNDYIELGTSSEALGYLGHIDMLNRFFKNDNNNTGLKRMYGEVPTWRFKGHAEIAFWRWVTSWAIACRKPSDLGFSDDRFTLPPLNEVYHDVEANTLPPEVLFSVPAIKLDEQREEKRRTIGERCERIAALVNDTGKPALVWCHLNDEGDMLESLIPDSLQVSGSHGDSIKEDRLTAFAKGNLRVLITKPKIGAWGLNFQHCDHVTFFPSHSYEQYYQAIRRCWRFGQKNPVTVDIVLTEGEHRVMDNLKRKAESADRMFSNLVNEMHNSEQMVNRNPFQAAQEVPTWLS